MGEVSQVSFKGRHLIVFVHFLILMSALSLGHSADIDAINHKTKECAHFRPTAFTEESRSNGWQELSLTDEQCVSLINYLNSTEVFRNSVTRADCEFPPSEGFRFICASMNYSFSENVIGEAEERLLAVIIFFVIPWVIIIATVYFVVKIVKKIRSYWVRK